MRESLRRRIAGIVNDVLDSRITTDAGRSLPAGYNPIERIRGALLHWVEVPFNGVRVWCELRCPNATQIEQCGDISNIAELSKSGEGEAPDYTRDEILQIRNYQENLCRLVFNKPTLDNIAALVGERDFVLSEKREELRRIRERLEQNIGSMTEAEKNEIDARVCSLELQLGFILPDDAMAFAAKWAMGNDVSHVKTLTRENLLRAASLAKTHGKAPSDYLSGVFTDHNKADIDLRASMLLSDFLREQEAVKQGGYRWFGGGGKKRG